MSQANYLRFNQLMQLQLEEGREIMKTLRLQQTQIERMESNTSEIETKLASITKTNTDLFQLAPQVHATIQTCPALREIDQKNKELQTILNQSEEFHQKDYKQQMIEFTEWDLEKYKSTSINEVNQLENYKSVLEAQIEKKVLTEDQLSQGKQRSYNAFQRIRNDVLELEKQVSQKKRELDLLEISLSKKQSIQQDESYQKQMEFKMQQNEKEIQNIDRIEKNAEEQITRLDNKLLQIEPEISTQKSSLSLAKTLLLRKQKTYVECEFEDSKLDQTQRHLIYIIIVLALLTFLSFISNIFTANSSL